MKHSGFQLEHCRPNCPKLARNWNALFEALKINLVKLNIHETLEGKFGQVLHHHIPKICIAGCPNGCSQPDIKDFGISGYVTPRITEAPCTECNACVHSCIEGAITLGQNGIVIDNNRCLSCGNCQSLCPSGTLTKGESGWNLRIGGRVGRHPRFATFAGQVATDEEVIAWVIDIIKNYICNGLTQERLTHFLENRANLV
ncbi:4Fe-4S dicluster domain-containing protein [Desulfosporosinus shakirovi]|uniref:4Fe-4S dicluster domain-containing protein n=1 Tax=Desulfosporosinus shakirovi TaxID=2885154 RepID=UPI001E3290E4|nr:4Fe-4S dicluster domain-containing protein [Desulfosporosinus sp. SRJS8]MCB8816323.1 4Fe-4S dicluster domain-containing protein [Desulfosporosinus sp. SRJS8]